MLRPILNAIALVLLSSLLFSCESKQKSNNKADDEIVTIDSSSISFLSDEIRKTPTNADLFAKRAQSYFAQNNFDDAIRDMDLAIKLDSMNASSYITIAEYYLAIGKSEKSKEMLDRCVLLFPENTDGLLKLAEIHFLVQQYKEAMELIGKSQRVDPLLSQPFFLKGLIYKETGDTLKAIENFQITVNKDPENYHAYMLLGSMNAGMQDSIALDYFRIALRLKPESIEALYNIGMFYQQAGLYTQAINSYKKIIEDIDTSYEFAYYNIGFIYLEYLKDYKNALKYFTETIELKNNYYQAFHNRGYAFEMLGDFNNAQLDYQSALNILPNYQLSVEGLNRLDKKMNK